MINTVSLLISAYNEQDVIEDKLINSLEIDYPKDRLEIVVVSDGSDDETNQIVRRYANNGVILRHYEGRIGKTACLNKAVPLSKGDIIVFSDADAQYDKHAIRQLVKRFGDEKVGFVTGRTEYISKEDDTALHSVKIYSVIEKLTKKLEGKVSSCVGADGAIFAIRKEFYMPLQDYDINDLVIPLKIIQQGFRGVFDEEAFCVEKSGGSTEGEFKRHVRIANRSLRAIYNHSDLLNPFKHGFFSFQIISHKLAKFMVPFFLFLMIFLNIAVVYRQGGKIYAVTLFLLSLFYILCWLGYRQIQLPFLSRVTSFAYTFFTINLAIFIGWINYFQGKTYVTWSTDR